MEMYDPRKRKAARKADGKAEVPTLGDGQKWLKTECRVPGAVVGWEHYESSKKGTPGLLIRFVVLDGPDAGSICETTFWLTRLAMDMFGDFLLALGHEEPLDVTNDGHLEKAFGLGAVMMDVKGEDYQNKDDETRTSYRPEWFGKFTGKGSKSWNPLVESAEKGWNAYVKWRSENPRQAPSSDSGGGYGGGGYSDGGGGGGGGSKPKGRFSDDDDIPFAVLFASGIGAAIASMLAGAAQVAALI